MNNMASQKAEVINNKNDFDSEANTALTNNAFDTAIASNISTTTISTTNATINTALATTLDFKENNVEINDAGDENEIDNATTGFISSTDKITIIDKKNTIIKETTTTTINNRNDENLSNNIPISSSQSSSESDNNNVPEWKRELLHRRKNNVARTIGANQLNLTTTCTKKDSKLTSPVISQTKTLNNINNSSSIKSFSSCTTTNTISSSQRICTNKILPILTTASTSTSTVITTTIAPEIISSNQSHNIAYSSSSSNNNCNMTINNSQFRASYHNQTTTQQKYENGISNLNSSPETKLTSSSTSAASSQSLLMSPSNSSTIKCISDGNFNNSNSDLNQSSGGAAISTIETGFEYVNTTDSNINGNSVTNESISATNNNSFSSSCSSSSNGAGGSGGSGNINNLSSTTVTTATSQELQHQQLIQLHSKRDGVRAVGLSLNTQCATASSSTSSINSNNNISYIKNPSIGMVSLNKATKYKISSAKLNSPSSNGSAVNNFQTKKMVALQQIDLNDDTASTNLDFDPSEELQYGPGIVSKLRCRYLSLALRQSNGKQRPPLDNLRRATSLNNLLDDDDDSNNGSVVDHVVENNNIKNVENTCSTSVTTPDEFIANFQKNFKISEKDKQRSRQLKRGNDSLKRARSVEALLVCDKSWDHVNNTTNINEKRSSIGQLYHRIENSNNNNNAQEMCYTNTPIDVTIEDKINHARERILSEKPPKRITPIIDDTERPPPDVVKQTLKIFEATANRRGRGFSRNNSNGEVAAKVANYKSIISQEKPPIVFPKPPLSPKRQFKKTGQLDIVSAKRNVNLNNISSNNINININKKNHPASPVSNLTKKFLSVDTSNELCDNNNRFNQQIEGTISPLPCGSGGQRAEINLRNRNNIKNESTPIRHSFSSSGGGSSPHTPDLIPRKHFDPLFSEALSPVTQITKSFEQLKLDPQSITTTVVDSSNNIFQSQWKNNDANGETFNVDEPIKQQQVLNPTVPVPAPKKSLSKREINQENNLNKPLLSSCVSTSSSGKPLLPIPVSRNSLISTTGSCIGGITSIEQSNSVKQVCVIRPLLAETKISQKTEISNCSDKTDKAEKSIEYSTLNVLNRNKINNNLAVTNLSQSVDSSCNLKESSEYLQQQLQQQQQQQQQEQQQYHRPVLTSQEIEKNLINEKKNEEAANEGAKWPFGKKKPAWGQQIAEAQNNSMVFNFKDRKEVPDYIENDGLLVKRRRELPKPNEPGFVLLGDLTVETSTDPDDSWTMGPPSPCDVEFENANVVIDGKSSIQNKPKDVCLKVQFNDKLTTTFEYPSESSLIEESSLLEDSVFEKTGEPIIHHHVKCDEIITPPGQKLLGNMSLGSAPLGNYTPIKAQICSTFELGVTRAPTPNENNFATNSVLAKNSSIINSTNGNSESIKTDNSIPSSSSSMQQNGDINMSSYLKPATDDHSIVYSEGSQKTDLLY